MYGHTTDKCTALKASIKQAKQKRSKHFKKEKKDTREKVNAMVERKMKKALNQRRRVRIEEICVFEKMSVSHSEQESISSSFSEEDES